MGETHLLWAENKRSDMEGGRKIQVRGKKFWYNISIIDYLLY